MQELLTDNDVVKILKLDQLGLKSPREALRSLRRTRQIGFVKQGRHILYTHRDVEDYIKRNHVAPLES